MHRLDSEYTFSVGVLAAPRFVYSQGARGRRLAQSAIVIQSAFRCMAAKRQLRHARQCATRIQAHWRGILGRRLALEVSVPIGWQADLHDKGCDPLHDQKTASVVKEAKGTTGSNVHAWDDVTLLMVEAFVS